MYITGVASYVPSARRKNESLINSQDISNVFLDSKIGVRELPLKSDDEDTSDLAVNAVQNLMSKFSLLPSDIDCLILCTQNPDGFGLPHVSAIVHNKIGLSSNCATFDISLGCSGFVYGINLASSFGLANDFKNVIFVCADPYSKVVNPEDKNTALLFGDAATATLLQKNVSKKQKKLKLCGSSFITESKKSSALRVGKDSYLEMNGRDVFNFAATKVPPQVIKLLNDSGLEKNQVSTFYFHQGSKYILDTLANRMGIDESCIYSNLHKYGNTVSSTIPLMLEESWDSKIAVGNKILVCGFGVGLSSACALLDVE